MITLTVNGISYQYPQVDDEDWGNQATLWASSVSDVLLCMRKPTLPTADHGVVRLGNTDKFSWRNFNNNNNVDLYVDVDDKLYVKIGANPAIDLTSAASGNVTGPLSSTDNALARYDGTTGQLIQNSAAILDDSANLSGLASVDATTVKQGGSALTDLFIDVIGSSTDNAIARWDSTTGKQVQNSVVTVGDTGDVAGVGALAMGGAFSGSTSVSTGDLTATGNSTLGAAGKSLTINADTSIALTAAFGNASYDALTRSSGTSVGIRGVAYSGLNVTSSTTSGTYSAVGLGTRTITVTGNRPVIIMFVGASGDTNIGNGSAGGHFRIKRSGSVISEYAINVNGIPPGCLNMVDLPPAGTYTYTLEYRASAGTTQVTNLNWMIWEA